MFIAATAMGLGGRIYGGPIAAAKSRSETLQIPAGFTPVIMLRVGNIEKGTDAVSGVALIEKTLNASKPQYREYIQKTSSFFPWFPKK